MRSLPSQRTLNSKFSRNGVAIARFIKVSDNNTQIKRKKPPVEGENETYVGEVNVLASKSLTVNAKLTCIYFYTLT